MRQKGDIITPKVKAGDIQLSSGKIPGNWKQTPLLTYYFGEIRN